MTVLTPPTPTRSTHHGRPCWQTRWRGSADPETGKRPRYAKRFFVDTERQAMAQYARWLADLELDPEAIDHRAVSENLLAADLCERYLRFAEQTFVKDGEITSHVARVKAALQYWIELPLKSSDRRRREPQADDPGVMAVGDLPANAVTPPDLARYRDAMVRWGGRVRSRTTIKEYLGVVRAMYRWAVERGLADASVWHGLQAVEPLKRGRSEAKDAKRVPAVSREVVDQTLPFLSAPVAAMVEVVWHTPVRIEEVVAMRGGEFETSGDVWLYRPTSWKTQHAEQDGKQRAIPIGPKTQAILGPFLKRAKEGYLFKPSEGAGKTQGHHGACYTTASMRRAIHRACDQAWPLPEHLAQRRVPASGRKHEKLETPQAWRRRLGSDGWAKVEAWRKQHRWKPNQLRHAKLTQLEREYGDEKTRRIAGHGNLSSTLSYIDPNLELAIEAARVHG